MKNVLRAAAVLAIALAVLLVYFVIEALGSEGGAKTGVAVAYIAGAIVLTALAVMAWRKSSTAPSATA